MNDRRLHQGTWGLGIVVAATAMSWFVATANFHLVDFSNHPRLNEIFAAIEGDEARSMAARYLASESNRAMFSFYAVLQLFGAVLAAYGLHGRALPNPERRLATRLRAILPATLVATALIAALLVPPIIDWGREIDFVSRQGELLPAVRSFKIVHVAYILLDTVKLGSALLWTGFIWFGDGRPAGPPGCRLSSSTAT